MSYNKGDYVKVVKEQYYPRSSGYGRLLFQPDELLVVVRTGTYKTLVRRQQHGSPSAWVQNSDLVSYNEPVRKLGEPPEGGLNPNDPGFAWFWEDVEVLAKREGVCPTYDRFCDELGVPGRERGFTVKLNIGGMAVTASVRAHSKREAESIAMSKLNVERV